MPSESKGISREDHIGCTGKHTRKLLIHFHGRTFIVFVQYLHLVISAYRYLYTLKTEAHKCMRSHRPASDGAKWSRLYRFLGYFRFMCWWEWLIFRRFSRGKIGMPPSDGSKRSRLVGYFRFMRWWEWLRFRGFVRGKIGMPVRLITRREMFRWRRWCLHTLVYLPQLWSSNLIF